MAKLGRLHGYLVIDKPAGWTSHDVVGRVRRLTGERHVGHAGTLDPAATGVLPVAVGLATRTVEYLSESSKSYLAEITLGVCTDSYDGDGTVTGVMPADGVDERAFRAAMEAFRGPQEQIPPMHSAIKIGGRKLYDLARQGKEIEREPRAITIHAIELVTWEHPVATVFVSCSKGTYIRSIARDLGEALGCGGYLSNLVRVQTGPFTLDDAWTLTELAEIDLTEQWESVAVHPDAGVEHLDAAVLDSDRALDWSQGKPIDISSTGDEADVRAYDHHGDWLGVAEVDIENAVLKPRKVVLYAA